MDCYGWYCGVGATLYVTRANKLHVARFFNAKLRRRQVSWLPCEVEALAVAVATKHFSPYIIQASSKLRWGQVSWLPCEMEALAVAVATKHFSPYIIQASNKTCILTDSKPCVQAFEKLSRGEFSASLRVHTFLSTVSRYQASVEHVAGSAILPTIPHLLNAQKNLLSVGHIQRKCVWLVLRNSRSQAELPGWQSSPIVMF